MPISPWSVLLAALLAIALRLWLPLVLFATEQSAPMTPELHLRWHPAVTSMDALLFTSSTWIRTVFSGLALFWLTYRAWQVVAKPVDELIGLLGLEVPVAPTLSLAGIKADGILLHWKPPENRNTIVKYLVRINGVDVGEAAPNDTSVTVTSLQPESFYLIRVVSLNTANFQAVSPPLRVKTLPASSGEFWNSSDHKSDHAYDEDGQSPAPVVRPYRGFSENYGPPIISPPPMTREHSNSQSRSKRADTLRRNTLLADQVPSPSDVSDAEESIQRLTQKLDSIRRENEEAEQQIAEEEAEFLSLKEQLLKEKDDLRQCLKDREDTTKGIKKEVSRLERQNAAAQSQKSNQERQLQAKKAERTKMVDDQERWKQEIEQMLADVEQIAKDKLDIEKCQAERIEKMQAQLAEEQRVNKQLEEDIRQKGISIKVLEEERKNTDPGENAQAFDQKDPMDIEADRIWEQDLRNLQARYSAAWQAKEAAEHAFRQARDRLDWINQRRASQPQLFSSFSPIDGPPTRRNSQQRRRRAPSMRNEQPPASLSANFITSAPPFNTSISSISPTFSSPSPYFNMNNGTVNSTGMSGSHPAGMSSAEVEALTGGAPMSPTAGALLPAGLLGDDLERTITNEDELLSSDPQEAPLSSQLPMMHASDLQEPSRHSLPPRLGPLPSLPGLGAPQALDQPAQSTQNPSSPVSVQSRSPSLFASPRDSSTHLPAIHNPANDILEADRRSIRSASSSLRSTTRFGSLFGFNRQRGKTTSDDGPALGSLKSSETQSLPRQDQFQQDPIGTQRRRGSYSGSWMNQLSSPFTRGSSSKTSEDPSAPSPKHVTTRKRAFNMFGSKGDPWLPSLGFDRSSSPRPGSTKSVEATALPRPSTESQTRFGWPVEGFGQRNSPLGADWGLAAANSWSRFPSRRPSIQYGGSSNNLGGEPIFDDNLDHPGASNSPSQAPIGTRPTSSQTQPINVPPTPPKQLNPAAPHFKSLFSREKRGDKAEKANDKKAEKAEKASKKSKDKEKAGEYEVQPEIYSPTDIASSPSDARQSRDTPSVTYTTDSNMSPRNSLDRSNSHTPSEAQTAPSIGKESFMSKLSRKSSSGKFNFPSFKSKKQPSEVGTPDEMEEDISSSAFLGRGIESASEGKPSPNLSGTGSSRTGLSWSSLKRMGKKGEKPPSLHESVTSEGGVTTGDEEEPTGLGVGIPTNLEVTRD